MLLDVEIAKMKKNENRDRKVGVTGWNILSQVKRRWLDYICIHIFELATTMYANISKYVFNTN